MATPVDVWYEGQWLEASVVQQADGDDRKVVVRIWEHTSGTLICVDRRDVQALHTHSDPWRQMLRVGSLLDVFVSRHENEQRKTGGWRLCRIVAVGPSSEKADASGPEEHRADE